MTNNRMYNLLRDVGIDIDPHVCIFVVGEEKPICEYGINIISPLPIDEIIRIAGDNAIVRAIAERLNTAYNASVETPTKTDKSGNVVDSNEVWEWRKIKQAAVKLLFPDSNAAALKIYKEVHKRRASVERKTMANELAQLRESLTESRKQAQEDRAAFMQMMAEVVKRVGK